MDLTKNKFYRLPPEADGYVNILLAQYHCPTCLKRRDRYVYGNDKVKDMGTMIVACPCGAKQYMQDYATVVGTVKSPLMSSSK